MNVQHTKMVGGGRVILPARFRAALGVKDGDPVVLELDGDELRVRSLATTMKRIRDRTRAYIPEGTSLVDELLADRRAESARD